MRPSGAFVFPVAMTVTVAALVGTAWLSTRGETITLPALAPTPTPVTLTVSSQPYSDGRPATLTATQSAGTPLLAGGRHGTITDVDISPGDRLTSGRPVYSVDGQVIRAVASSVVFFRPFDAGVEGKDVAALQTYLRAIGEKVPATARVDAATRAALTRYAKANGFPSTETASPSWFVRIPADGAVVSSVEVQPGLPSPEAGAPLGKLVAAATNPTLQAEATAPDGDWLFAYSGRTIKVKKHGDRWQLDPVGAAALLANVQPTDGKVQVEGRVRLAHPIDQITVPGSAVISTGDRDCVAKPDGTVTRVTISGDDPSGAAVISQGLSPGDVIVVNPAALKQRLTCP